MQKKIGIIMVLLITTFIGFAIIIPVLPKIVSVFHMNMMLALYSAVSFIMSPIWGKLSDKWGRRPIILTGILGFSVSFFVFAVSLESLWLMYISRILGGFFSGAVTSCAVAYVADITTNEKRTKAMGLVGMSIGLGFIFGPAIGGLLSTISTQTPFFVSSGLAFVTFIFVLIYLTESLSKEQRQNTVKEKVSRWAAFTGPMKYLYVMSFFVTFTLAGLEGTLIYYQETRFDATSEKIGIMFLISGIVGALIQGGVIRRYVKPGTESRFIQIGLLLSAAGFILLLFSNDLWTASLYLSVFAAGNAFIRPCVISLITQKTKVGQGVATGLNSSMDSLGRIAGPLFATALFTLNETLPFIVGAIICVAAIQLVVSYKKSDVKYEAV
ncbi:MFS transporter [Chengkuizengella axinellae]|uniref:MFS transporter n=1 Tax=Chengkuizengella axinellae TaxID=3064388 RepID=A0ABT9IVA5_9BACL|nr:MFS transporter [Chengkuizengella sp. 2205SS18-9]MDP5273295.1 MFS transporter [Chengkuizengella sp. 2205SS18-9]